MATHTPTRHSLGGSVTSLFGRADKQARRVATDVAEAVSDTAEQLADVAQDSADQVADAARQAADGASRHRRGLILIGVLLAAGVAAVLGRRILTS